MADGLGRSGAPPTRSLSRLRRRVSPLLAPLRPLHLAWVAPAPPSRPRGVGRPSRAAPTYAKIGMKIPTSPRHDLALQGRRSRSTPRLKTTTAMSATRAGVAPVVEGGRHEEEAHDEDRDDHRVDGLPPLLGPVDILEIQPEGELVEGQPRSHPERGREEVQQKPSGSKAKERGSPSMRSTIPNTRWWT